MVFVVGKCGLQPAAPVFAFRLEDPRGDERRQSHRIPRCGEGQQPLSRPADPSFTVRRHRGSTGGRTTGSLRDSELLDGLGVVCAQRGQHLGQVGIGPGDKHLVRFLTRPEEHRHDQGCCLALPGLHPQRPPHGLNDIGRGPPDIGEDDGIAVLGIDALAEHTCRRQHTALHHRLVHDPRRELLKHLAPVHRLMLPAQPVGPHQPRLRIYLLIALPQRLRNPTQPARESLRFAGAMVKVKILRSRCSAPVFSTAVCSAASRTPRTASVRACSPTSCAAWTWGSAMSTHTTWYCAIRPRSIACDIVSRYTTGPKTAASSIDATNRAGAAPRPHHP